MTAIAEHTGELLSMASSALYLRDNIAIADYRSSLKRDVRLLWESKGTLSV